MNLVVSPNPCGIRGIAFVEFAAHTSTGLRKLFRDFGFSAVAALPRLLCWCFCCHWVSLSECLNGLDTLFNALGFRHQGLDLCKVTITGSELPRGSKHRFFLIL